MKVWVIMGNDFPDCVFDNEESANKYIEAKKDADPSKGIPYMSPRIYWRAWEFEVKK